MSQERPNPEIESMLQESDWLHALARSLVRDASRADDVVQDAWIAALQHQPHLPTAEDFRRWISAVVRNNARQVLRSEGRRSEREQSVARSEDTQSTQDLYHRTRRRQEIVDHVLQLDEPYRAVILLRYFEGLPPRKIAARLDLPVNTVKTRLQRGMDQLRARLTRDYGDSTGWALALIPLALGSGWGGTKLLYASRLETLWSSLTLKLAVGLAATGAVVWGVASNLGDPEVAPARNEQAAAHTGPDSTRLPDPIGSRAPESRSHVRADTTGESAPLEAVPEPRGWKGLVRDEFGLPISAADVVALDHDGAELGRTRTDSNGQYQLLLEDLEPEGAYRLLEAQRFDGSSGLRVARSEASAPPNEVDLTLPSGFPVRVRTLDRATGRPLAGVTVELTTANNWMYDLESGWFSRDRSDASGELLLTVPGPQEIELRVRPSQSSVGHVERLICSPGAPVYEVRVESFGLRLALEAQDAVTGRSIAEASFSLIDLGEGGATTLKPLASQAGRLEIERPEAEGAEQLLVEASGYYPVQVMLAGGAVEPHRVELHPLQWSEVEVRAQGELVNEDLVLGWAMELDPQQRAGEPATNGGHFLDLGEPLQYSWEGQVAVSGGRCRIPFANQWGPDHKQSPGESPTWPRTLFSLQLIRGAAAPLEFGMVVSDLLGDPSLVLELTQQRRRVRVQLHGGPDQTVDNVLVIALPDGDEPFALASGPRLALLEGDYRPSARTDGDGIAELALGFDQRPSFFCFHAQSDEQLQVLAGPLLMDGVELWDLAAPRALGEISGVILNHAGTPSPVASGVFPMLVLRSREDPLAEPVWVSTYADGTFLARDLPRGEYVLETRGFPRRILLTGDRAVELRMPELFQLEFDLVDGSSGLPASWSGEASVEVDFDDGERDLEIDSNGRWRTLAPAGHQFMANLPGRVTQLTLSVPGFEQRTFSLDWPAGEVAHRVGIELMPARD